MKKTILILISLVLLYSCTTNDEIYTVTPKVSKVISQQNKELRINYKLGFPVNYPTMKGYYDANSFGNITSNGRHLGADLNKPGNSDFRDTIYSIGYGEVRESDDAFLAIKHRLTNNKYIIASYFHCDTVFVQWFDVVKAGQPIALIGKKYTKSAHLHFEIITDTTRRVGFYGDCTWCVDPIKFINNYNKNRGN